MFKAAHRGGQWSAASAVCTAGRVPCRETQVWVRNRRKESKRFQPLGWSSAAREALWTSTPHQRSPRDCRAPVLGPFSQGEAGRSPGLRCPRREEGSRHRPPLPPISQSRQGRRADVLGVPVGASQSQQSKVSRDVFLRAPGIDKAM